MEMEREMEIEREMEREMGMERDVEWEMNMEIERSRETGGDVDGRSEFDGLSHDDCAQVGQTGEHPFGRVLRLNVFLCISPNLFRQSRFRFVRQR